MKTTNSKIYLGADHGGFVLKEQLKCWLTHQKIASFDLGTTSNAPTDYPRYAFDVAQRVSKAKGKALGILFCRSGGGMTIAANKVAGVRAVECQNPTAARHAKEHNNANILVLSGDWLSKRQALAVLRVWLATPFSQAPRHRRRLAQISHYEKQHCA